MENVPRSWKKDGMLLISLLGEHLSFLTMSPSFREALPSSSSALILEQQEEQEREPAKEFQFLLSERAEGRK